MGEVIRINEDHLINHRAKQVRKMANLTQMELELVYDEIFQILERMEKPPIYQDPYNSQPNGPIHKMPNKARRKPKLVKKPRVIKPTVEPLVREEIIGVPLCNGDFDNPPLR